MSLACAGCPVRDRAACAVLSDQQRDKLARGGRIRNLRRNEMLFAAGDPSTICATLISGMLKVVAVDDEGRERILALIHPAGFVGELFAPFAHHDVVALTDSRLCVLARNDLEHAIEHYPQLASALLRRSAEDLYQSREMILRKDRSARSRVADLLLATAEAASHSPCHAADEFELPLKRGDMAGLLGMTIETVSRTLTSLEKAGAIRRKGARGIEMLDAEQLRRAA